LLTNIVAESDPALRRIERDSVMACGALALTAAIVTRGVEAPLGVLGGGLLVAISYRGIKAGATALADAGSPSPSFHKLGAGPSPGFHKLRAGGSGRAGEGKSVAVGLVKFFTRYAILAVAAYLIMARLRLPPLAVFAGASSLVVAVMVEALRGMSRGR
jgi:hypothetical protein